MSATQNIQPAINGQVNKEVVAESSLQVALQPKSQRGTWKKPDGGSDGMTALGRLVHFLTMDGGENLLAYLGTDNNGNHTGVSRQTLLKSASNFFALVGAKKTPQQIETKLRDLIKEKYPIAYKMYTQSGEGALGKNASESGKVEFRSK